MTPSIHRIAIVSPSGPVEHSHVQRACQVLRSWGFEPVLGRHCLLNTPHYGIINHSATLDDRWDDLRWAIEAPDIDAIVCARGGYGAIQIVDRLTPHYLRAHSKLIVGFSDITALHGAWHHAGLTSIHGPMTKHLAEEVPDQAASQALKLLLTGHLPSYRVPGHPFNRLGTAQAPVLGGNLAVMHALLATPYNLIEPGCILFIEDIAEQVYQVQRMLHSIRLAGLLPQIKGLIVGQFTNYRENPAGDAMYTMIRDMVAHYGFPVAFDFPVGHTGRNVPIPEGVMASLTVTQDEIFLDFLKD